MYQDVALRRNLCDMSALQGNTKSASRTNRGSGVGSVPGVASVTAYPREAELCGFGKWGPSLSPLLQPHAGGACPAGLDAVAGGQALPPCDWFCVSRGRVVATGVEKVGEGVRSFEHTNEQE